MYIYIELIHPQVLRSKSPHPFPSLPHREQPTLPRVSGVLAALRAEKDQGLRGRLVLRSLLRQHHRAVDKLCRTQFGQKGDIMISLVEISGYHYGNDWFLFLLFLVLVIVFCIFSIITNSFFSDGDGSDGDCGYWGLGILESSNNLVLLT